MKGLSFYTTRNQLLICTFLIGPVDSPEKFPCLIKQYLAQGGVHWPAIPVLAEATAPSQPTEAPPLLEAAPKNASKNIAASPTLVAFSSTPTPGLLKTGDLER